MPQAPNLQIVNGGFQNAEGGPLDNGYLLFELSHDSEYSVGPNQVVAGLKFRVDLDETGNVPADPIVKIYSNDVLLPSSSFYYVRLFDKTGTEAWASPQIWSFIATPNPIDLGTVVPASPSGSGLSGGIVALLETNGTPNGSQTLLNLQQGTGVTLTDNGSGQVTVAATGATGTVTHTGALTTNAVILGDGGADVSALPSLGTTTTVLHGNAGGAPSFGSVTEGDISLTNTTTNDVSITKHGFAPILPNDATKFLNGVGSYSTPSGSVTHTGALTANAIILGNGAADITALGSLGTTTTLLHGNAAGAPTFGAVVEGDISLSNVTTNDVSIAQHGFAPKAPNDATKFLDGTGAYSTPTGGTGTVTHTGGLTSGQLIIGNGTADIKVGDLSGDVTTSGGTAALVAKIQGNTVDTAALGAGQDGFIATWINGTGKITFVTPTAAGGTNAIQIRGVNIATSAATPLVGEQIQYDGTNYLPAYSISPVNTDFGCADCRSIGTFGILARYQQGTLIRWIQYLNGSPQTTYTGIAVTSTERPLLKITTDGTAGHQSAITGPNAAANIQASTLGILRWFRARLGLGQTTLCRLWVGLSDVPGNAAPAAFISNTPASTNFVGFFYNPAVDSHFQIVTQKDATHQTMTPTTVSGDTDIHIFELYWDGSAVQFLIDRVNVGNIAVSANLPTTSIAMDAILSIDNIATSAAKFFKYDHHMIVTGAGF